VSYVKLVLALVLMAIVLYFAILNGGETIELRYSPASGGSLPGIPTSLALFGAFLLGAVIVALMGVLREVRAQGEVKRLRRENRAMAEELDAMRAAETEAPDCGDGGSREDGSPLA